MQSTCITYHNDTNLKPPFVSSAQQKAVTRFGFAWLIMCKLQSQVEIKLVPVLTTGGQRKAVSTAVLTSSCRKNEAHLQIYSPLNTEVGSKKKKKPHSYTSQHTVAALSTVDLHFECNVVFPKKSLSVDELYVFHCIFSIQIKM